MKVAMITDSFPPIIDGVSRSTFDYANALYEYNNGTRVVITPRVPNIEYIYPFPVYCYKSIKVPYADYRTGHPFTPKLISKLKDMNLDILHVHSPFTAMTIARQLRHFMNIPIVFTQHTKWHFDIARAVSSPPLRKVIERYAYNNIAAADDVWAVSRGAGEYLITRGFKGSYVVMPNGTDFVQRDADQNLLMQINNQFNLPPDVPTMLFVGRMMWYKNIGLIIEALEILRKRKFDFRMIFVGDGEDLPAAIKLAANKGLSDFVHFAGRISNRELLGSYYSRADLFIFPSVYDTAGLVIQEASARLCPSVVVRGSAASEILVDGESGFFADETAISIANTIQDAFHDKERLKKVAATASEQVFLPWNKAIIKALERYQEVKTKYKKKLHKKTIKTVNRIS